MTFGFLLVTCLLAFGTYWATKYALMEGSFFGNNTNSVITTTSTTTITPKYDEGSGYEGSGDIKDDFGSGGKELQDLNEGSAINIETITPDVRVGRPRSESGLASVRTTAPPQNMTSRRILDIFEDESMMIRM